MDVEQAEAPIPDHELVAHVAAGDSHAFAALFRRRHLDLERSVRLGLQPHALALRLRPDGDDLVEGRPPAVLHRHGGRAQAFGPLAIEHRLDVAAEIGLQGEGQDDAAGDERQRRPEGDHDLPEQARLHAGGLSR